MALRRAVHEVSTGTRCQCGASVAVGARTGRVNVIEFEVGDLVIGAGEIPGRKTSCLTVRRGSVVYTCAYFRNKVEEQRFTDAFKEMLAKLGVKLLEEKDDQETI